MSASSGFARFWGVVATLGLTISALVFLAYTVDEARHTPVPIVPVLGMAAVAGMFVAMVRGPIGRGIGRMLEGQPSGDDQLAARVSQLEAQDADLMLEQQRLMEVEERLDFAERLLAQRSVPVETRPPEIN
jgi:hypothetical protein